MAGPAGMDAAGALGDCASAGPATATLSRAEADRVSSERRVITWAFSSEQLARDALVARWADAQSCMPRALVDSAEPVARPTSDVAATSQMRAQTSWSRATDRLRKRPSPGFPV